MKRFSNSRRGGAGFTLIELMISLVVGGMLMAGLVAISTNMQKSSARTRQIVELQTSIRFGMKTLLDDFKRVAFMGSPNPRNQVGCGYTSNSDAPDRPAIEFNAGLDQIILRGNFISSKDYFWDRQPNGTSGIIRCMNGSAFDAVNNRCATEPGVGLAAETYYRPFNEGAPFASIFCGPSGAQPGMPVRLSQGPGKFLIRTVATADPTTMMVNVDIPISFDRYPGNRFLISPISEVRYQMARYPYSGAGVACTGALGERCDLFRSIVACGGAGAAPISITGFLLPPNVVTNPPGLAIADYRDPGGNGCYNLLQAPAIENAPAAQGVLITGTPGGRAFAPAQERGMVITLRVRSEFEDPTFTIPQYATDPDTRNYGLDLDNNLNNGLAHVRVLRAAVDLPNIVLSSLALAGG